VLFSCLTNLGSCDGIRGEARIVVVRRVSPVEPAGVAHGSAARLQRAVLGPRPLHVRKVVLCGLPLRLERLEDLNKQTETLHGGILLVDIPGFLFRFQSLVDNFVHSLYLLLYLFHLFMLILSLSGTVNVKITLHVCAVPHCLVLFYVE